MRALYIGQLHTQLSETLGVSQAAKYLAEQHDISERTVYRDANLSEAFAQAEPSLQEQFIAGDIPAKELIEALKPVVAPPPAPVYTAEEMAERHRAAFPNAVHEVAQRVVLGIRNLRHLCADVELVFKNQGIDLDGYAPEIVTMWAKLKDEEEEAESLQSLVYEDGEFKL